MLASLAFAALAWSDLNRDNPIALNQDVQLTEKISFKKGNRFEVVETIPLETVPVMVIEVRALDCPFPEATAEMTLVDPRDPKDRDAVDRSVGLVLNRDCDLEIYVEQRDYPTAGFFDSPNEHLSNSNDHLTP